MNRFGIKVYYNDFSKRDGDFIDHYLSSCKKVILIRRIIGNIYQSNGIYIIKTNK